MLHEERNATEVLAILGPTPAPWRSPEVRSAVNLCVTCWGMVWCLMATAFPGNDAVCSYRGGRRTQPVATASAGTLNGLRAGLQLACACRWLAGAYFMLVTMLSVGYGDITPHTNPEIIVCMFALIAGIIFFGILLGSIAEALNVSVSLVLICLSSSLHTSHLLRQPGKHCFWSPQGCSWTDRK